MFIDSYIDGLWIYFKFMLATIGYISISLFFIALISFVVMIIITNISDYKLRGWNYQEYNAMLKRKEEDQ